MFPTYYYYYYTQINTKKVGVGKSSFSWCGQSFQEIEAQSLWILVKSLHKYSREAKIQYIY
jgi:hypothetical protein